MCIAAGGAGNGVGENDLGVRFADLTGNGRADYLCLIQDSQVTGYLNNGMKNGVIGWSNVGQIKFATGYDRANVRFNDVNGKSQYCVLRFSSTKMDEKLIILSTFQVTDSQISYG